MMADVTPTSGRLFDVSRVGRKCADIAIALASGRRKRT